MDVSGDVEVIAMDIARDDQYLLVVTENGFGKRTLVGDYRKTNRGAKGVKTIQQTEAKGRLAGALVVREHHQLVFISQNGMVQRIAVRDFRPLGRNAQGFRLMNIREDDRVSAVALVMEDEASTPESAEPVDPDTLGARVVEPVADTEADTLAEAGPADPTDPATITPPEVDTDDIEP
jgi:DNA gyrase subunit A